MGYTPLATNSPQTITMDTFEETPFDETDLALWGIGGILICLMCTCYAINVSTRRKRLAGMVGGSVVLLFWGGLLSKKTATMSLDW